MGQKVHPIGYRVGVSKPWESSWFAEKAYPEFLLEDYKIRKMLQKEYKRAFLSRIEIARFPQLVNVTVFAGKPGILIGRKGAEIEVITNKLSKLVNGKRVSLSVKEIKQPELDAAVIGADIASQIERRVAYKRAIKQAIRNAMRAGAQGIKIRISGRLNNAEIARSEEFKEGRMSLNTLSADIDYRLTEALTQMGIIGIKVWLAK
ncbi:small subunit ribosomal protein S3 [Brevinema andersonii]|uniref:Small ribosomal subunit protein uS3 n=1 Tax=Brevinema andersonii TaxID=34097 RepID=A0A1I1D1U3_BREAD|nr:30S ribosomal protein S3 [Brevinema andersonii]SFB68296.1 small subunit ribosomal protein S3 [Brevinema andersonii]